MKLLCPIFACAMVWSLATGVFGQAAAPGTMPAMPSGHPVLPAQGPAAPGETPGPGHTGGMVAAKTGALRVNFAQGTKDGPPLGKDPVTVQLLAKGKVLKSYKTAVNDNGGGGQIEIHELPLDEPFQPVITVEHGGAQQQLVGPAMHKFQPMIELDMKVYEVTTEKPAWTIGIRSISTEVVDLGVLGLGLQFVDTLGCNNPADRAWVGEPANAAHSDSRIFAIPLPAEARDVQFGPGMAEAGAKVVGHDAVRGKTMLPGMAQYVLGYTVAPKSGGKVTVTFAAPADTGLFALYLPGDVKIESSDGLETSKASGTNGQQNRQLLVARSVTADKTLTVTISGLKLVPKAELVPQTTDLNLPRPTQPESKP